MERRITMCVEKEKIIFHFKDDDELNEFLNDLKAEGYEISGDCKAGAIIYNNKIRIFNNYCYEKK